MALRNGKKVQRCSSPPASNVTSTRNNNNNNKSNRHKRDQQNQSGIEDSNATNIQRENDNSPHNNHDHNLQQTNNSLEPPVHQKSSQNAKKKIDFVSSFPSLTIDNMEEELDNWTLVELRKALVDQKHKRSRHKCQIPTEVQRLVELIRLDYEKRMLMAALIGGVSETMIWSVVNAGAKKGKSSCWIRFLAFCHKALSLDFPARGDKPGWTARNKQLSSIWKDMDEDEKMVFRDPYFFALAKLPNLSDKASEWLDMECEDFTEDDPSAEVAAPPVHQLTEEEEALYKPLFDRLVDVEKVHENHGKPDRTESTASLQQKSLAAFRKAHHDFATACQRFHIHYHLTALSCDVKDGWNQVYSTNKSFSEWADDQMQLTTKFKYYVHGKLVAQEIDKKKPQPVDARRGELTRELNRLMNEHMPKVFPKLPNPSSVIRSRGWPVRLVLTRPDSALLPEELDLGFRDCDDSQKKKWLEDIRNGFFYIEKIPPSEMPPKERKRRKSKKSKKSKKSITIEQSTSQTSKQVNNTTDPRTSKSIHNVQGSEDATTSRISASSTTCPPQTKARKKTGTSVSTKKKSQSTNSKKRKRYNESEDSTVEGDSSEESEPNSDSEKSSEDEDEDQDEDEDEDSG